MPSIGRIVHYRAPELEGGDIYAALITRVHEDWSVDFVVFGTSRSHPSELRERVRFTNNQETGGWFWPSLIP
jgi:hypothetical protein